MFHVARKTVRVVPKIIRKLPKNTKARRKDIKYETKMAHKLVMKSS